MGDFKKPERKPQSGFSRFLYIDGAQVVNSLSAIEGGEVDSGQGRSLDSGEKSKGVGAGVGLSGARVSADLSSGQKFEYEENIVRQRTGYSKTTDLLQHLRDSNAIGQLPLDYDSGVHQQIEEQELYEFEADIRLHPFHQLVSILEGADTFSKDWDAEDEELTKVSKQVSDAFYGKDSGHRSLTIFADIEDSEQGHKIAMTLNKSQLLGDMEDLQGKATFIAQIDRKIREGQKLPAARLVRETPIVTPFEVEMMKEMLPLLNSPMDNGETLGIDATENDLILRHPAITVKPLCIYKG